MDEDVVEEPSHVLHKPGCPKITEAVEEHPAGTRFERKVAPRECWICRPAITMMLW